MPTALGGHGLFEDMPTQGGGHGTPCGSISVKRPDAFRSHGPQRIRTFSPISFARSLALFHPVRWLAHTESRTEIIAPSIVPPFCRFLMLETRRFVRPVRFRSSRSPGLLPNETNETRHTPFRHPNTPI
jgi:hypothetical protein